MIPSAADDEGMIAQSVLDFAERMGGVRRARALRDRGTPFDPDAWRAAAGLGWLGICVPEAQGGLGLGLRAACVLLEMAGRKLLPEPVGAGVAAAFLLGRCGDADPSSGSCDVLARLLSGEIVCALAGRDATRPAAGETTAGAGRADDEGALTLHDVPGVLGPGVVLLGRGEGEAFTLRSLETGAAGVDATSEPCVDGSVLTQLRCAPGVIERARVLASGAAVEGEYEAACAALRIAHAAYLVGVMDEALRASVAYLRERIQFGVPLATFQALQHRAATCYVDVTATRALVREASRAFGTPLHVRASAAAAARACAAALRVCKEAIQFHGSFGFADEADIGLYLRRAMSVAAEAGGAHRNERLFAACG